MIQAFRSDPERTLVVIDPRKCDVARRAHVHLQVKPGEDAALLACMIREIIEKDIRTVNMLGCHDGIPVLDLRGKTIDGVTQGGLLSDEEIDAVIDRIMDRGGRVKNLYGPDGKKIAYYQINATFFSALGEDERKLRLARAIQMFMPGIPQVWYLDLFAGKNDYAAADKGAAGGHKEINRTTLDNSDIEPFDKLNLALLVVLGGLSAAVAAAPCPKVYIPNLGADPESLGMGLAGAVRFARVRP